MAPQSALRFVLQCSLICLSLSVFVPAPSPRVREVSLGPRESLKRFDEDASHWSKDNLKEQICEKKVHEKYYFPWNKPLFKWGKDAERTPADYLPRTKMPVGEKVALWQHNFFKSAGKRYKDLTGFKRASSTDAPIRATAPTLVTMYFENDKKDAIATASGTKAAYMKRLKRLIKTGQQIIVYTTPDLKEEIRAMRPAGWVTSDNHLLVIDKYTSIREVPNVKGQEKNFAETQHERFRRFDGYNPDQWEQMMSHEPFNERGRPNADYFFAPLGEPMNVFDDPFKSAVYSAKAFFMWDAVMRNPWRSLYFMLIDAGIMNRANWEKTDDEAWWNRLEKIFPDDAKVKRVAEAAGDRGVFMVEWPQDEESGETLANLDHDCWTSKKKQYQCIQWMGGLVVGTAQGFLEFAVKFMMTSDVLDANGWYIGREEAITPYMNAMYPNTVITTHHLQPEDYANGDLQAERYMDYPRVGPILFMFSSYPLMADEPKVINPCSATLCAGV